MKIKKYNEINESDKNPEICLVIASKKANVSNDVYYAFNNEEDAKIFILDAINEDLESLLDVDDEEDILDSLEKYPMFDKLFIYYEDAIDWSTYNPRTWQYDIEHVKLFGKQEVSQVIIRARETNKYNI